MSALKNDEFSWFMKSFVWHGESDLARIEWWSANLTDRGEQNMDLPPCSSSHHPFFDWISHDTYKEKPRFVILTILTFLTKLYMVGDLVYRIKLFCQMLSGSYTTNTQKLCSKDRFVIWLAQAPWRHRKLEPTSCWLFQSLVNLVMVFTTLNQNQEKLQNRFRIPSLERSHGSLLKQT